jgi:transcriptional regulator with PAS, ATPase and Fis domain
LERLREGRWDGNVRELQACLVRAVRACEDGIVRAGDLSSPSLGGGVERTPRKLPAANVRQEVEEMEVRRIREAMARTGGITKRAAELLGIHEKSLSRRLDRYGLRHLQLRRHRRKRHPSDETVG